MSKIEFRDMKIFKVYKTDYKSKIPKLKPIYSGYKRLKRGLALLWNGNFIPLVLPVNER